MEARTCPTTSGRRVLRILGRALLATLIFQVVAIVLFRSRWEPGIDAVRRFNKRFLNPVMLRFAGRERWYASVVHHEGRKSGKAYATPIWVVKVGRLFYIPLPYGTDVDWCRNVMHAGGCILESRGSRYEATSPAIVSAEAAQADLPWRDWMRFRTYGVDAYLRLEKAPTLARVSA